jgi:hypothetical protein
MNGIVLGDGGSVMAWGGIAYGYRTPLVVIDPQADINKLVLSMRRRCQAVSIAHGGHTRYWLLTLETTQTLF